MQTSRNIKERQRENCNGNRRDKAAKGRGAAAQGVAGHEALDHKIDAVAPRIACRNLDTTPDELREGQ